MNEKPNRYIGIDLGTTFSAMAYLDEHGTPVTIPNHEGILITPSVVFFESDGNIVVGQAAQLQAIKNPTQVVSCVKREMGERFYSQLINGRKMPPPTISAFILKKLKQDAEAKIGPVAGAVITVPAYFDEGRRQATIAAGQIAGLEVIDIINEPTAAALAYAYREVVREGEQIEDVLRVADEAMPVHHAVVYDLGGGTFDVTILRIRGKNLTVLATDGDVKLGGKDWDERLVVVANNVFKEKFKGDLRKDKHAISMLFQEAEKVKKELSKSESTHMSVVFKNRKVDIGISRKKFDALTADLLYRTENRLNRVILDAHLNWGQIDHVLTVGGSTRMPQVLAMLKRVTGKEPNASLAPDEAVAHGAAIHAAIKQLQSRRKFVLDKPARSAYRAPKGTDQLDVLPMLEDDASARSGMMAAGDSNATVVLSDEQQQNIGDGEATGNARPNLPPKPSDTAMALEAQFSKDLKTAKSVQALKTIVTHNVNAHSLGLEKTLPDGSTTNSVVIPRNTTLPCNITKIYGTLKDNQENVSIIIVEGEAPNPRECIPLGICKIDNLPFGLPKGSSIEVTFSYDNSGRLDIHAKELSSGRSTKVSLDRAKSMKAVEINRVKKVMSRMTVTDGLKDA